MSDGQTVTDILSLLCCKWRCEDAWRGDFFPPLFRSWHGLEGFGGFGLGLVWVGREENMKGREAAGINKSTTAFFFFLPPKLNSRIYHRMRVL